MTEHWEREENAYSHYSGPYRQFIPLARATFINRSKSRAKSIPLPIVENIYIKRIKDMKKFEQWRDAYMGGLFPRVRYGKKEIEQRPVVERIEHKSTPHQAPSIWESLVSTGCSVF